MQQMPQLPLPVHRREFMNGRETIYFMLDVFRTRTFLGYLSAANRGDARAKHNARDFACYAAGRAADCERCVDLAAKALDDGVEVALTFSPPWYLDDETARGLPYRSSCSKTRED